MAEKKESFVSRLIGKIPGIVNYCKTGVWHETKDTNGIRILKVINLSVRSFLDRGLQTKSMSLTYSTVLAVVPALALLFAIGRGFGFQKLLEDQLFKSFPAQRQSISFALDFVDSYLKEASQGIFVGIGILFLLWTLISLLSYIESAFNEVWDVRRDRSMYQKITDYVAICLMVPVLMICSSGVSIFMGTTIQDNTHLAFLTPLVNVALEAAPVILAWLAFSLSFFLIPNTKVQFKYAAISGGICAVLFQILQMLFVSGQIYVSKYNAIYGSFSFLPLLLIWLQLSWLILLSGCVLTYSLQNVRSFSFMGDLSGISANYIRKVSIILTAAIVGRFRKGRRALTRLQLSFYYDIPVRVVSRICENLNKAGLVNYVVLADDRIGIAPAVETGGLSVGELLAKLDYIGEHDLMPGPDSVYAGVLSRIDLWLRDAYSSLGDILIADIDLPEDKDKEQAIIDNRDAFLNTEETGAKVADVD